MNDIKVLIAVSMLLGGCSAAPSPEPTGTEEDSVKACTTLAFCVQGYTWSQKACKCLPDKGGEKCGTSTCGKGEVCCNASCGICTPPDGACIQIACVPQ